MGLRYRKSIRLGGGVRVNVSGRGVGWSVGGKGFRYTKPAGGRRPYSTVSLPGTGISYRSTADTKTPFTGSRAPLPSRRPGHPATRRLWGSGCWSRSCCCWSPASQRWAYTCSGSHSRSRSFVASNADPGYLPSPSRLQLRLRRRGMRRSPTG